MKLFSILNKPANKAGNKQAGLVFLEYVIMAFIVTVAVICALWWFYWHLQQMTWEVKAKLDTLKTLNCELQPPYGAAPEDQPKLTIGPISFSTPEEPYTIPDTENLVYIDVPFRNQKVVLHNTSAGYIRAYIDFYDLGKSYPEYSDGIYGGLFPVDYLVYWISPGSYSTISYNHGNDGPYKVVIWALSNISNASFTVTVTPGP